jgi:hypothetical protein
MLNWFIGVIQRFLGGGHGGSNSVPEFDGTSSIAVAALLISIALVMHTRAKRQ